MKHININGKRYPFRLTIGAMVAYKRDTGEDFSAFRGDDMEKLGAIIFHAVRSACRTEAVPFPFREKEEMLDYIDMQEAAALLGGGTNEGLEPERDEKKS